MPRPRSDRDIASGSAEQGALRLLARREHSARQLKAKLEQRGLEASQVAELVDGLARQGWQSDTRYAELLVRSRRSQNYGPERITAELRVAGVEPGLIAETLEQAGVDWDQVAEAAREKRFGALPANAAEAARQYRHLLGRGFEPERIRRLLREHDN